MFEWALDVTIGVGMVWLAWKALAGEDLYRSVILFIAFGLVLSLAWARLDAPDIALAEAAIGAGLTGALLLDAAAQLRHGRTRASVPRFRAIPAVAAISLTALGLAVTVALAGIAADAGGLTALARESLPRSGVGHGVTAVLLNFRAFDTLLEVGVLLAAVLAMLVVRRSSDLRDAVPPRPADPVLTAAAVAVLPLMVLTAGYLFWLGTHAPGGAFQAGAVLASAAVLLFLTGRRSVGALPRLPFHLVVSAGFVVFLIVALATSVSGMNTLELHPAWAGTVIVVIEGMVAISIAAMLAALFIGGAGAGADIMSRAPDAAPEARSRS